MIVAGLQKRRFLDLFRRLRRAEEQETIPLEATNANEAKIENRRYTKNTRKKLTECAMKCLVERAIQLDTLWPDQPADHHR